MCVCVCVPPYREKWEETGGLKWRKRRRASSVAVLQIEKVDFSPEKTAAWLFKMPFFSVFGKEYHCHFR